MELRTTSRPWHAGVAGALSLCMLLSAACSRGNGDADGRATTASGCFLDARLRGALEADLQWHEHVQCEGAARPEGRGLRAVFSGRGPAGEPLRIVFGIDARPGQPEQHHVPARVTLLVEGGARAWATHDDGQCSLERLDQQPVAGQASTWRLRARGYCIDPAASLAHEPSLSVERFDFEGQARFEQGETAPAHRP